MSTVSATLDALVGQVLDERYRIDALLGAGGMGAVFKAHHLGLDRDVAVKVLHPELGSDEQISKRFDREAQSASRLDHPNCVHVDDFGTTEAGIKYLVMELLEGEDLDERVGEPWEVEATLDVLDQVLAGLEHAHHHDIVHRDLKPENVFLAKDFKGEEVAKIVDFGIAKLLDAQGAAEALTRAGMVFGTPRYMSPEQAAGGKIDERSDLYSLGLIAYTLLAGAPAFDDDDLAAVLRMQIMAPAPDLPASVPKPVARFVESLLEKSRHDRPESAAAARAALAEVRRQLTEPTLPEISGTDATGFIDVGGDTGAHPAQAHLPADPKAMVGHTVDGRYRLDALLGVGGMGAVFKAADLQAGEQPVAVKVLHAAFGTDDEISARFQREAETAGRLVHPNIVPVITHGSAGMSSYLVMPLLEGVELRQLCAAPLAPARAAHLMLQLLAALDYAHGQGVVHRDLKPENVFVIPDGQGGELVQLVDFGLAKVAEGGSSEALTRFGQVFGTPAYMSPEQARGETVDARADIYAAGVMLYELLLGRPPFDDDDPVALMQAQLFTEPPPLPESFPPALRELVASMLVKDRDERVPDAATARARLEALAPTLAASPAIAPASAAAPGFQPTIPPIAPQPSAGMVPPPPSRARRLPLWVYGLGAVVAILIIVAAWPTDEDDVAAVVQKREAAKQAAVAKAEARPKPDDEVYIEIDRALSAKQSEEAQALIATARDEFPEDGGLLWREGRALALGSKDDRVTALQRYGEAISADPRLAEEADFEAELHALLRDKKLRDTAIDVAVRELGSVGHSFLLEVINDEKNTLGFVERQRVLDELRTSPDDWVRVDVPRHQVLDLEQAHEAPKPCTEFREALETIEDSNDPYFLPVLFKRNLDIPEEPGVGEDLSDCTGLDAELQQVRGTLAVDHPEQAAAAEKASKRKKKRRGFGGLF